MPPITIHSLATKLQVVPAPKTTLYERITSLLRARGRAESERQFCRNAGIPETYLSQLKVRCRSDPKCTGRAELISKIARALGVPVEQLLGHEVEALPGDDAYPGRAAAVVAARALQYSEDAIASVYHEQPTTDPGRLWWFKLIELRESVRDPKGHAAQVRLTQKRASRPKSLR